MILNNQIIPKSAEDSASAVAFLAAPPKSRRRSGAIETFYRI
jgi:hypothetical protein